MPFSLRAFEVRHHHVGGLHAVIIHTARFDEHNTALTVDAAGVAAVHGHEAAAIDAHVGFVNVRPELFKCGHLKEALSYQFSAVSQQATARGHDHIIG